MGISLVYYDYLLYFYCQYANNNILLSKVNIMKYNCVVKYFYNFRVFTLKYDRFRVIFRIDYFLKYIKTINLLNAE